MYSSNYYRQVPYTAGFRRPPYGRPPFRPRPPYGGFGGGFGGSLLGGFLGGFAGSAFSQPYGYYYPPYPQYQPYPPYPPYPYYR